MFDPHKSTYRNKRVSHKGQVIQCRPMTPPFTFEMKTWKKYEAWAKKNNLIPNPEPTDYDYVFKKFLVEQTILSNMSLWGIGSARKIFMYEAPEGSITPLPFEGQNMYCVWFSPSKLNATNFALNFNAMIFYHTNTGVSTGFTTTFIVDPIAKKAVFKITMANVNYTYCNVDENGPYIPTELKPCQLVSGDEVTWIIEDPEILSNYVYLDAISVTNTTFTEGKLDSIPQFVSKVTDADNTVLVQYIQ